MATQLYAARASAQDDVAHPESAVVKRLHAASYVTWWSLDATGYHPAVLVKVENASGGNLSGELIRFQARFVDMREGTVTVARREIRQQFVPGQEIYVPLRGPQAFELPIDVNYWPPIEVKVMCRVGQVGDEGTQTLLVTRLEQVTMSDEDARHKLSLMPDFASHSETRREPAGNQAHPAPPPQPLKAAARALKAPARGRRAEATPPATSLSAYLSSKAMPGLGDDFYEFEKAFGLPVTTDTSSPGWAWAEYRLTDPEMVLFTGSKGSYGKADVILIIIPASAVGKEQTMSSIARAFAGKLKSQQLGSATRSVRYLPAGRTQVITQRAPGYQAIFYIPSTGQLSGRYTIGVSRSADLAERLIADQTKKTRILRWLAPLTGAR